MNKPLSEAQKSVLDTVRHGGRLLKEEATGSLFLSDKDGNDYRVNSRTIEILISRNYLKTGAAAPALGLINLVFNYNRNDWK